MQVSRVPFESHCKPQPWGPSLAGGQGDWGWGSAGQGQETCYGGTGSGGWGTSCCSWFACMLITAASSLPRGHLALTSRGGTGWMDTCPSPALAASWETLPRPFTGSRLGEGWGAPVTTQVGPLIPPPDRSKDTNLSAVRRASSPRKHRHPSPVCPHLKT